MKSSHHRRVRSLLFVGATTVVAACADLSGPDPRASDSHEAAALEVARGLALALAAPGMRELVRDEMRASLLTEHKLVLQEFVATPVGRQVLEAGANALEITPDALKAMIGGLPEMDFYAPFREHRLTWRATPDVVVAAAIDTRATFFRAYDATGAERGYDVRRGAPAEAVLMIHPAQRKSRRIFPQKSGPGWVIQDPDDGELSGTVGWRLADGRVAELELAVMLDPEPGFGLLMNCDPGARVCIGDGGGGSGAPADTTFLNYLWVNYYDGLAGSNELEFTSTYFVNVTASNTGFLRIEGVYPNEPRYPNLPLIFSRMREGTNQSINVQVVETDPFFNDDKGNRTFVQSHNGQPISITKGSSLTNVELGWVPKY